MTETLRQLLAGGERRRGIRIDAAGEDLEQAHEYGYFDRRKSSAVKAGFLATARVIIGLLDEDCRDASFSNDASRPRPKTSSAVLITEAKEPASSTKLD